MAGEGEFEIETNKSEGDITTASDSGSDTELSFSDIEAEDDEDVIIDWFSLLFWCVFGYFHSPRVEEG